MRYQSSTFPNCNYPQNSCSSFSHPSSRPISSRLLTCPNSLSSVMASIISGYRCLSCRLTASTRPNLLRIASRGYATTPLNPNAPNDVSSKRLPTRFSDRLNTGPAFADFVGGKDEPLSNEDALELRTAMVGPAGKKKVYTRLPEWLKTPIPSSNNFKKIKQDLRGLNLHTGVCNRIFEA